MEVQMGNCKTCVVVTSVHCPLSAALNGKEWFWGVVLISLLIIGCVESNPGPRSNETRQTEQPRRHYGSIESRHGRQWGQEETTAAASSGCWPFLWWCVSEPPLDERNLLESRAGRRPGGVQNGGRELSDERESEDEELLQDHQVAPVRLINQQSEIDVLKEEVKILESKLEQEVKQRQEERQDHEAKIAIYEKFQVESVRIHNDLHVQLDETVLQKTLLEQQLRELENKNEQRHTEENAEKFTKEFHRRKQLEEELERERQERKQLTAILEQEIVKRQLLEQEMRLQELNREAELRELNQEQEIQRRQLQQAVEMEVQRRQEVTQQLECETQLRHEEAQLRRRLEVQLQEEIQAKNELEMEFKQADLQSQLLEQELRHQMKQMERVFTNDEHEDVEVASLNDTEEVSCAGTSVSDASSGGEVLDKAEDREAVGDEDNNNDDDEDDDEKQEIRQLLLEEFQRLQIQQEQEKLSANITADTDGEIISTIDPRAQNAGERDRDWVHEAGHLVDVIATDLNTEFEPINLRDLLQNEQQGADPGETNVTSNILLAEGNGGEGTGPTNHERVATDVEAVGSDIIIRGNGDIKSPVSEEELSPAGYGERRNGILLQESLSFGLEGLVEDTVTEGDNMSQSSDYSDILSEIINFQGNDVTVASLIGDPILPQTQVLLDEFKMSLSTESKPVIGSACAHSEGHYIPRTLQRNAFLRSDVLNKRTSKLPPVFAVSGMTEQELKETVLPDEKIGRFDGGSGFDTSGPRIVLLNDVTAARDFKDLCTRARNFKTIHWLAKQPDGFEWRSSKGNMDVVHQYTNFSKSKHIPSITNLKGEAVIIRGNPGEGKSTYLTHLQSEFKRTSPDTWVIRLNLNEHLGLIEKCDVTEAHVIEILSSAAGLGNSPNASLGKALLTYSLQITGKVVLLVDEISVRHRDKVHDLLRVLKNIKVMNLVIAADTCISTAIENGLSTLAFTLKPLAKEELQLLMTQFWQTDLKQGDDTLRDKFAAELLDVIGNHSISGYSPTPLDIKILSHIFEKEYMSSLVNEVTNLPKSLDKFQIYERYIAWEFEMYKNNDAGSETVWDSYLAHVTHFSMSSFFPEDDIEKILSLEESTREITDKLLFLSRNLQEYVTAKWFAENYQSHRSFIEDKYFEVELQTMWGMFERILAKQSKLHMYVLDGDIQRVRDLLSSGVDVNSLDNGGRTALHICALKGKYLDSKADDQCVIASLLIDHDADTSIVDGILKWTALRYADKTGCWPIIDRLLQGVAVDISDMACTKEKLRDRSFLQDFLTEAAVNGSTYVVAFILDTGVDINTPLHSTRYSHQQYGLVHIASENGHISLLEFLLEKGADTKMCIWENSTALHLACKQGNKECVVALLERSARIDQSNKKGDTALHEAVRSPNSDIVQILLSNKADADLCNKHGDTPLHVACQVNNLAAVSHLMDTNTYKNNRNKNGDSPLDCAIRGGHTTLVKYILKAAKESVMDRQMNGNTPAHLAAETGDVLMLEYLLQVMPEVNVCTDGGDTPLHIASLHGNTDAVAFLLTMGANSDAANKHGNTALHLASVRGYINTMKALLECNAQVNATNKQGNTPLHLVCLQGQANAARCLVTHNAHVDVKNREKNAPIHLAAIKSDISVIASLVDANCDVNLPNKHGDTILHQCAENGNLDVVKLLVSTGRCHLDARNSAGDTPLLTATKFGFADVVDCLARDGADINCLTKDGAAPIHLAVMKEDVELVTKLCCLGADLNIRNSEGNTPLHKAVYRDNEIVIRKLVEHGAERSVRNLLGYTPLELAVHLESNDAIRRAL